jgi:lantibiotic biosynthesis protein
MSNWEPILDNGLSSKAAFVYDSIGNTISKQIELDNKLDLLRGKVGQLLFLSHFSRDEKEVSRHLECIFDKIKDDLKVDGALMTGLAGLGYVIKIIQSRNSWLDVDVLNDFFPVVRKFAIKSIDRGNFDFMYGYLGQCYFLLEQVKCDENRELFKEAVRDLESQSIPQEKGIGWINPWEEKIVLSSIGDKFESKVANLGMSHGLPGIIYILVKLQNVYPELEITSLIERALYCLISQESEQNKDETGFYYPIYSGEMGKLRRGQLSWCYSDLGISMMFYNLWNITGDDQFKSRADKISKSCAKIRGDQIVSMCSGLCHGASGIAHMFNKVYQITKEEYFKDIALYWYDLLFNDFLVRNQNGSIQAINFEKKANRRIISNDYGFLEGLSGIGLSIHTALLGEYPYWDKLLLL